MRKGWTFIDVDKFEDRFNDTDPAETVDTLFAEFETIIIGLLKKNKEKVDFKPIRQSFIERMQKFEVELLAIYE